MLSVFDSVLTFSNELSLITVGAIAAIFTLGFIQGAKRTVLTPFILAYFVPSESVVNKMTVSMKNGQYLYLGEFLAEFIQWIVFMLFCYFAWLITRGKK